MTKFLNTDLDTTLGGVSPSDEKVSSQKAIKTYVDTEDAKRVSKTSTASQVYGTDSSGNQTTLTYATSNTASTIVQRDANKQVNVATTPTANSHAASKSYVDTEVGKKVTANNAITGATHTKITYDSKGLVTGGADIVTADVTDLTATATELNYVAGVTSAVQTQIDGKVSKSGDSMTNNLEMTNGSIYLEGIGGAVASSTSRLNLGTPSNVYAYLTGNTSGAFGIYSEKSGSRTGIACYPGQNFFADATTKTIDLGRSNNVWKIGYIDTLSDGTNSISIANIINKVTQTNAAYKIYGTDSTGAQTTISYSNTINAGYLVQRDSNAQVIVPEVPVADENAASKKYVDGGLALKANSADLATVATSGSYNDLSNTPTFKTINSEVITGTGNILLQTQLSGTNGNVVTYTSTTGTLGELGFDNTPTQNSNKLVKSGPIWTELQKKVNITDIKNNLTSADTDKPLSAYQGKVLDEKITLAQQSTHDRGVVLNSLTSQGQNYTITAATINAAGTNYTVGDTLFLTSDMSVDAVINVTAVNSSTGAITSISLGQGGAFTTAPTSPSSAFIGGTGTGAKFALTTSHVNNSTLASISNPQPNDFATVLDDEIHNNLRYVWKYADIDGDGTYEWVSGYPITNIERNFQEQPIENTELATNAVTTVKIANNNVTADKIADDAILGRHISTGAVTDDSVASGAAIQQSKIANLTTDLANKVSRTSTAYQLYGTAAANTETTLTYKTDNTASTIVQRDANSQINVAQTPTANTHATSKKYVNDQDALKVDKVSTSKRVYGTDASGNQTTYDYDSFGKVDDVKVGTTSVLVNKIATLGTMAGESKDDYTKTSSLAAVALSNDYNDLDNLPTVIQSDWTQGDNSKIDFIKNKPNLATIATSGSYNDLSNKPTIPTTTNNITQGSTAALTSGGAYTNLVTSVAAGGTSDKITVTKAGSTSTITVDGVANATTAQKLGSSTIGSTTTPIYLSDGVATPISYSIAKSVPSDAKFTDTTYDVFTGATASTAGVAGLVKKPSAGDQNKFLKGDGNWSVVDSFPTQTGNSGKFLTTNGSAVSWANIPQEIPSQSGNAGKYLTTNGTAVSWGEISEYTANEVETLWNSL